MKHLIVWGDKDTSYNFDQVDTLNKNIKNSRLEIFENCSHNVHLEKPNEFNILVENFINLVKIFFLLSFLIILYAPLNFLCSCNFPGKAIHLIFAFKADFILSSVSSIAKHSLDLRFSFLRVILYISG